MKKYLQIFTLIVITCLAGCQKDTEVVITEPKVTTGEITSVTTTSFDYESNITEDGGASVTARGVCYGTSSNPTISDSKTTDGSGTGAFSGTIQKLTPETTSYVRAYATNSAGTGYGEVRTVKLLEQKTLQGAEQAYPGVKGEPVTVSIGGIPLQCVKIEDKIFYQGDILIDPKAKLKAAAADYDFWRWPDNIVYYVIDANFPNKERVEASFTLFNKTDISFKERTAESNYVLFKYIPNAGCYSWVGMIGGEQEIVIDNWGDAGTIAHEIGHALGLLHEQSKPDRDQYIKIITENIIKGYENNFDIWPYNGQYTEGFDFNSLMCYHSWSFPIDPSKPTMTKLDGSTFNPQRAYFTEKDLELINRLYPAISAPQLEKQSIVITEGESVEIAVTEGTGSYTVESDKPAVVAATINGNTLTVKGVAEGNATVTVTDAKTGKTATCSVTVERKIIPVTGVTVSPTSKTVTEGDSFTLTATVSPANADNNSVNWQSSDATVAEVDATGKVTTVKPGTAVITATTADGSKTATCTVTVTAKGPSEEYRNIMGEIEYVMAEIQYYRYILKDIEDNSSLTLNDKKQLLREVEERYWMNRAVLEEIDDRIRRSTTLSNEERASLERETDYCLMDLESLNMLLHDYQEQIEKQSGSGNGGIGDVGGENL